LKFNIQALYQFFFIKRKIFIFSLYFLNIIYWNIYGCLR
jgi:hypothetical protein